MRRNRNDRPTKNKPKANFVGVVGSYLPSRIQSHANAGARRMTKIAWTETNQLDGLQAAERSALVVRFFIRLAHEAAFEPAVHRELDSADAQPVVTLAHVNAR